MKEAKVKSQNKRNKGIRTDLIFKLYLLPKKVWDKTLGILSSYCGIRRK